MAWMRPQSPPLVPSPTAVKRVDAGGPTHHGGDNGGGVIAAQPASADAATDGGGVEAQRDSELTVPMPYVAPMRLQQTLDHLAFRAVDAVESVDARGYTRTMSAAGGPMRFTLAESAGGLVARIRLTDPADLTSSRAAIVRLFDLDADSPAIDDVLSRDATIKRLIDARPGLRSPGAVDGFEVAIRGIIGQQISVKAARTQLNAIVARHGVPAFPDEPYLLFPSAAQFAAIDPDTLAMPRTRARTMVQVASECATGRLRLEPGADPIEQRERLLAMAGIGPWTADYIVMRATRHTDILLTTDLGVIKSAQRRHIDLSGGRPDLSPWRSYLTNHLWAAAHDN